MVERELIDQLKHSEKMTTANYLPSSINDKIVKNTKKIMPNLKFGIEAILDPQFGVKNKNINKEMLLNVDDDSNDCTTTSDVTDDPINKRLQINSDNEINEKIEEKESQWPAWVYCTRYSDRPSSGPRVKKVRKKDDINNEKRPRTAFSGDQLARLRNEFSTSKYLTESRRQALALELGLNEAQIKIWFQNKRAKLKKASGSKNPLALQLMAQGLYNHSTIRDDSS